MIAEWIASLGPWAWIILGLVLIGLELLASGIFLIWFGIAAILTGLIDGFAGLSWQSATLLFATLSVICVLVGRALSRRILPDDDPAGLNRRGESLVGRTFTLEGPMVGGEGRIRVGDSSWRATGPDQPAGAIVRVVRLDGATLIVEAA